MGEIARCHDYPTPALPNPNIHTAA